MPSLLRIEDPPVLLFVLAGALLLGLVVVSLIALARRVERRRVETLARTADDLGLVFRKEEDAELGARIQSFQVGQRGHSKQAKNRHSHVQSLAIFESVEPLPDFVMAPEGFFSKVAQLFGSADIDFFTHPDFSKKYVLKAEDDGAVRALFTDPILEHFEQSPGWTVESAANRLVVFRNGKRHGGENAIRRQDIEPAIVGARPATRR